MLNIKGQILLACIRGEVITISKKFTSVDHILNSHDLWGWLSIDITSCGFGPERKGGGGGGGVLNKVPYRADKLT